MLNKVGRKGGSVFKIQRAVLQIDIRAGHSAACGKVKGLSLVKPGRRHRVPDLRSAGYINGNIRGDTPVLVRNIHRVAIGDGNRVPYRRESIAAPVDGRVPISVTGVAVPADHVNRIRSAPFITGENPRHLIGIRNTDIKHIIGAVAVSV